MRIWTFSDFHLEHGRIPDETILGGEIPDADVCVVAGDLHAGPLAIDVLARLICPVMPVIYVAGNHDYYQAEIRVTRERMREMAAQIDDLYFLDPGTVTLNGVKFIGATLWTDYDLVGPDRRDAVMKVARRNMNDHHIIGDARAGRAWPVWTPEAARTEHLVDRAYIAHELKTPGAAGTVVVTHHGISRQSIAEAYLGQMDLNAAFVSDLDDTIREIGPDIWIHGHVHNSVEYVIGGTRVRTNPRGYALKNGHFENPDFDPHLIMELPAPVPAPAEL